MSPWLTVLPTAGDEARLPDAQGVGLFDERVWAAGVVYAMAAPADGAADVATDWRPRLGHPTGSGSYSVPDIVGGVREAEARALVVNWLETGVSGGEADFARLTLG